ncbi:MxaK protein [Methylomonas sp. SURF-2]|uniref:MxaK protein n=1 Tax=Methylomonas subterranea TaxID=2952225 RepID=A0ABT1TG02_9GAMM|nr:MxaK protein [Methylomonas sp. SURF-2]MCQ8104395.1 MxaK protein [Methylomonas sp. SURF-2]
MRALRHKLIWAALVASLLLAATQLWSLYRIHRENALIAEWVAWAGQSAAHQAGKGGDGLPEVSPSYGNSPQARLARAIYLRNKRRYAEALDILSLVVGQGDSRLQAQSRYSLGNLYLSQARDEVEAGRINQAMPLLTLAKQAYRQALTLDSGFWDAKYNLELAMKLLPEFDRISPTEPDDDAAKPSQLWTTVPGFPRGLP